MYISLFDINLVAIGNPITNVKGTVIEKAYDFDEIDLTGYSKEKIQDAVLFTLNEDSGRQRYSGFIRKLKQNNNNVSLIGRDFRTLFSTDIVLDFVANTPPTTVGGLFSFFAGRFKNDPDVLLNTLPFDILTGDDSTVLSQMFGELAYQVIIKNAYEYILPFLKYYGYVIRKSFNTRDKKIEFNIDKTFKNNKIKLEDFSTDLQQSEPDINKAVAMQKNIEVMYEWKKQEYKQIWKDVSPLQTVWSTTYQSSSDPNYQWVKTDAERYPYNWIKQKYVDGQWVDVDPIEVKVQMTEPYAPPGYRWYARYRVVEAEWKLQELVYDWVDVEPLELQWATKEPTTETPETLRWAQTGEAQTPIGSVIYYYLDKNNNIIQTDETGNVPDRYFPIKTKYYAEEYLSDAQYKAVLDLCNNRFVDNIYINTSDPNNPVDLKGIDINDKFNVYRFNTFYKQLPVSEKHLNIDDKGIKTKIKLGFKRDRLTSIVEVLK